MIQISNMALLYLKIKKTTPTLREKCLYLELFWPVFSRIRSRKILNTDTFHAVQAMLKAL